MLLVITLKQLAILSVSIELLKASLGWCLTGHQKLYVQQWKSSRGGNSHERCHEAIGNLCPVDVYEDRAEDKISTRRQIQQRTFQQRRKWNSRLIRQAV